VSFFGFSTDCHLHLRAKLPLLAQTKNAKKDERNLMGVGGIS